MGTKAYLYFPDCYGQEALVIGSARTNGAAGCFGNVQNRELATEHGKQLQLHAESLGFVGGTSGGRQQTLLGLDSLYMQAGAGRFVLRSAQDICFQAPKVTMRTPLAINQHRTGQKIKKNPATGGTATSITSQYEFSISSPLGELIGTEYEEYNPFENEISYELYEDVENKRLTGLAAGILTALAIGALVGVVAFTGGALLAVALGIGAVVAGVGSLASAATYIQDKENSRASDVGTYVNNAKTASLITTAIVAMLFGAPAAAQGLTHEVTQGASLVGLFGKTFTYEQIATYATWGVNGLFTANGFFQLAELGMFFAGEKELGEETGGRFYDDAKELTEGYAFMIYMLGVPYMSKGEKAKKNVVGENCKDSFNGRTFKSKYDIPTNEKGYTKSSLELGKKIHKEYKAGEADGITKFKEYTLPSGKRVDYIDFETKTVYELKPHNPNQIKNGIKQLQNYLKEIESVFGEGWTSILDTY